MQHTLSPHDVFAFRNVADPRIAWEGGRIIATVTRRDIATDARLTNAFSKKAENHAQKVALYTC